MADDHPHETGRPRPQRASIRWPGIVGSVVVLALIVGVWGDTTKVSVFGIDLRPGIIILIAYLGGYLSGLFQTRRGS